MRKLLSNIRYIGHVNVLLENEVYGVHIHFKNAVSIPQDAAMG